MKSQRLPCKHINELLGIFPVLISIIYLFYINTFFVDRYVVCFIASLCFAILYALARLKFAINIFISVYLFSFIASFLSGLVVTCLFFYCEFSRREYLIYFIYNYILPVLISQYVAHLFFQNRSIKDLQMILITMSSMIPFFFIASIGMLLLGLAKNKYKIKQVPLLPGIKDEIYVRIILTIFASLAISHGCTFVYDLILLDNYRNSLSVIYGLMLVVPYCISMLICSLGKIFDIYDIIYNVSIAASAIIPYYIIIHILFAFFYHALKIKKETYHRPDKQKKYLSNFIYFK